MLFTCGMDQPQKEECGSGTHVEIEIRCPCSSWPRRWLLDGHGDARRLPEPAQAENVVQSLHGAARLETRVVSAVVGTMSEALTSSGSTCLGSTPENIGNEMTGSLVNSSRKRVRNACVNEPNVDVSFMSCSP